MRERIPSVVILSLHRPGVLAAPMAADAAPKNVIWAAIICNFGG